MDLRDIVTEHFGLVSQLLIAQFPMWQEPYCLEKALESNSLCVHLAEKHTLVYSSRKKSAWHDSLQ